MVSLIRAYEVPEIHIRHLHGSGSIPRRGPAWAGIYAVQAANHFQRRDRPSTMNFTSFAGNTRTIVSDAARRADFNEIPVISLEADKETLLKQLTDACTRVGFFYLEDHGVPQEKIDKLFGVAENFFAQPLATKNEINYKNSAILRGYEPPAEVRTDETRKPDLNEAFNWGYEGSLDPARGGSVSGESGELQTKKPSDVSLTTSDWKDNPMSGENVWPDYPNFKDTVADYYGDVLSLARRMIKLFAEVLQLPPDFFDSLVSTPGAMGRLIHYPPQPANDPEALG